MARGWRCRLWLAAVILAVITACAGSPNGSGAGETPGEEQTSSSPEQVAAVFDGFVEDDPTGRSDALRAVLVLVGGRPLVERYYDSSAEATSNVASVTKSVMSILVGVAIDEGDLGGVDQTLSELLPEHAAIMAPDVAGVTLQQVLTMTAGLPEDPDPRAAPSPYSLPMTGWLPS